MPGMVGFLASHWPAARYWADCAAFSTCGTPQTPIPLRAVFVDTVNHDGSSTVRSQGFGGNTVHQGGRVFPARKTFPA